MSFKIVQTIEPGQKLPSLSVVPAAWEENNILLWPNSKRLTFLNAIIRDPNSKPLNDWIAQPCIKKRENFLSYEAAEFEMDEMSKRSDTDNEVVELPQSRLRSKRTKPIEKPNFNAIIENGTSNKSAVIQDINTISLTSEPVETGGISENQNILILPPINTPGPSVEVLNIQDQYNVERYDVPIIENFETETTLNINDTLNTVLENQKKIIDRQETICKEIATQRTMLEFICDVLTNNKESSSDSIRKNVDIFNFLPVSTIEELNKLEADLLSENNKQNLIKKMEVICGTTGKMNGINCCYTLIDSFFKRDLLKNFSWSGGSRSEQNKISFKTYKNTIRCFYEIVAKADMNFSEMSTVNFFKSIVKNAKRRALIISGKTRTSSGKKRPSNLKYATNKRRSTLSTENINGNNSSVLVTNETEEIDSEQDLRNLEVNPNNGEDSISGDDEESE